MLFYVRTGGGGLVPINDRCIRIEGGELTGYVIVAGGDVVASFGTGPEGKKAAEAAMESMQQRLIDTFHVKIIDAVERERE